MGALRTGCIMCLCRRNLKSNRNFFYPPKKSLQIKLIDSRGQPFFKETKYARIKLVHIPFISVRSRLPDGMLKTPNDPGTLMLSLVRKKSADLTVNLISSKIIYKGLELDMMPAHMAVYAFFAIHKKNCKKKTVNCGLCRECFMNIQSVFDNQAKITDLYKKIALKRCLDEMSDTGVLGLNAENFNMYKGKIKRSLLIRFGPCSLKNMEIASEGIRPNTCYGILADKAKIKIVY